MDRLGAVARIKMLKLRLNLEFRKIIYYITRYYVNNRHIFKSTTYEFTMDNLQWTVISVQRILFRNSVY